MTKYKVIVIYTMQREITVYAGDESEAEDKACNVVLEWKDVIDAEAMDVMEE